MVIVFDLDDTLFADISFVFSGFQAVANDLSKNLGWSASQTLEQLKAELIENRSEVFDRFLIKRGAYTKKLVKHCVSIYRTHDPHIALFPEADACLQRLTHYPLYVVTDGNKLVQKRKFLALGLKPRIKKCVCTYAYGMQHSKPSPYCFEKICRWEKVAPQEVIYIADNPQKDFIGIKPLGFKTVRVLTGPNRSIAVSPHYEADIEISNLNELSEKLLLSL
jgi:putative hydrolase of the HAD superfamily